MESKNKKLISWILVIAVAFGVWYFLVNNEKTIPEDTTSKMPPIENASQIVVLGKATEADLIGFSIWPGTSVRGVVSYRGTIQGAYFFEANILVGVADANKNIILQSNGVATTDWMTAGPVDFEGYLDFTGLPVGPAYVVLHNDNASGLPENDKAIYIPVIIQ